MIEIIKQHSIDFVLLAICIIVLLFLLHKYKKSIQLQKIIAFGPFAILSMALVKTTWGLKLMDKIAKKYNEWVKLFGLISIGVGFVGIVANFLLLGMMLYMLYATPKMTQVGLVLPFTEIPGLGFLSFSHWIIAIFILATVHEFAHGVVARAHGIPVKSSGFAALQLFHIPLIPAAFVEPDEKVMPKKTDVEQYSVLCAGPISNLILAIPFWIILVFILTPVQDSMMQDVGFSFTGVNQTGPAGVAGLKANTIYNYYNDKYTTDANQMVTDLQYRQTPGNQVSIGYLNQTTNEIVTYKITTSAFSDNPNRAMIGVTGLTNNKDYKPEYANYAFAIDWIKDLFKWLFLFNFLIGLMNLMPLYITDGGQIIKLMTQKVCKNDTSAKKWYHIVCSLTFWIIIAAFIIPIIANWL